MSSEKQSIGQRIKIARENAKEGAGLSQFELAELTGIKQASLSQIESNKTTPRKPTLIALSFVLNDDFGEEWLKEFFKNSTDQISKEFNHTRLAELFNEADSLDAESIKEMEHIWEMLKIEIARRKK